MIRAALHIIVKKWKQQKCTSIDEWINNTGHVHTMKYHLAIKRKETLIHTNTQVKFENTMLSEKSQLQKTRYHMIPYT